MGQEACDCDEVKDDVGGDAHVDDDDDDDDDDDAYYIEWPS